MIASDNRIPRSKERARDCAALATQQSSYDVVPQGLVLTVNFAIFGLFRQHSLEESRKLNKYKQ